MNASSGSLSRLAWPLAVGFGLFVALVDRTALWGDDSEKLTILLWLFGSAGLGFLAPARPWRWAVIVGPMLPIVMVGEAIFAPGRQAKPLVMMDLLLVPVSLAFCLIGVYAGSVFRQWSGRGREAAFPVARRS
ncbi:MAG: hypothetical protein U0794_01185 [Isosphaeraceae bacterium]